MKILHTADWHIGKRLDRFLRIDEQREVLTEIAGIADAESVDLVLVAGDLYDTVNPGSEAEELLYQALTDLSGNGRRPVIAIAGNHDSPDRINAPDVLARRHGINMVGYPAALVGAVTSDIFTVRPVVPGLAEVRWADNRHPPVRIIMTPYANEYRLRSALIPDDTIDRRDNGDKGDNGVGKTPDRDDLLAHALGYHWNDLAEKHLAGEGINLLVTHLFFAADPASPPEEPESERPIGHVGGAPALSPEIVPAALQYVACGHLHRPHTLSGTVPVRYAGSPLSYSFSEAEQTKSVTIVELDAPGTLGQQPEIREVPLTSGYPLRRYTAESVDAAVTWLAANQDCYVELTVDLPEYLSGPDRNLLHQTHPRLVTIIPRRLFDETDQPVRTIDPTGDIRDLFSQYFTRTYGTPPDDQMKALLEEVLAGTSTVTTGGAPTGPPTGAPAEAPP